MELHVDLAVYQTQELNEREWRHPVTFEKGDKRLTTVGSCWLMVFLQHDNLQRRDRT
jgi:hypothetical protein